MFVNGSSVELHSKQKAHQKTVIFPKKAINIFQELIKCIWVYTQNNNSWSYPISKAKTKTSRYLDFTHTSTNIIVM